MNEQLVFYDKNYFILSKAQTSQNVDKAGRFVSHWWLLSFLETNPTPNPAKSMWALWQRMYKVQVDHAFWLHNMIPLRPQLQGLDSRSIKIPITY